MSAEEFLKLFEEMDKKFTEEAWQKKKEKCSKCEFKDICEPMVSLTHDCYGLVMYEVANRLWEWRKPFWNDKLKKEVMNYITKLE